MRLRLIPAFILLIAASMLDGQQSSRAVSASQNAVEQVLEMKRQYDVALLAGDSGWFNRAFADNYVLITGDGSTYGKAQIVKQLASKEVVWQAAAGRDMKVRVYGHTAVVTGQFTGRWLEQGKPIAVEERFTSVWVKAGDRWRAVSEHVSNVR